MKSLYIFAILLLLQISTASRTTCSEDWECSSSEITNQYNFVHCDNGNCKCRSEWGFAGNATTSNPCRCEEPGQILWNPITPHPSCVSCLGSKEIIYDRNGIPRCIDPAACEEVDLHLSAQTDVIRSLYSNMIYPTPTTLLNNTATLSNIFSASVKGRITPIGATPSYNSTVHFFYALAGIPDSRVVAINFVELRSVGNVVSVQVDITFNRTSDATLKNLTQVGFFYFNSDRLIQRFDITILRLGLFNPIASGDEVSYRYTICQVAEYYCPNSSPYRQYNDSSECIDFLSSIPIGTWDALESNSVVCRLLSSMLVPLNPKRLCRNIGPSGGTRCLDKPYEEFYAQDFIYPN